MIESLPLSEIDWLLDQENAPQIETVLSELDAGVELLSLNLRLRKTLTPQRAAAVIELAQLRIRARGKFSNADQMYFTRRGLEQSSGEKLAAFKANRFLDLKNIADVCCGIGGDLIALARNAQQSVTGIDKDPVIAGIARRNLEVNRQTTQSFSRNSVQAVDFRQLEYSRFDGFHFDPDRRSAGRTVQGNHFQPPLEAILPLAQVAQLAAIKVAPATPWPRQGIVTHRQWLGNQRECKQQVLWLGKSVANSCRSATVIFNDDRQVTLSVNDEDGKVLVGVAETVKAYLAEPHATVIAAGLVDALAVETEMERIHRDVAYLTSDCPPSYDLLSVFEVLDVVRLDRKAIQRGLDQFGLGVVEIKHRGIEWSTAKKFHSLRGAGHEPGVVILSRWGQPERLQAVIARRPE